MEEHLLELVEQFGTPLYVYDAGQIKENIREMHEHLPNVEIHFACKALTNQAVLKLLISQDCGIDAVSKEEVQIAMKVGYSPRDINFTPSGSPLEAYLWCMDQGVQVHVDNLELLEEIAKAHPEPEVVLRFNPNIRVGGHRNLQVGAGDSKFGLHRHEVKELNEIVTRYGIKVIGVHLHVGSDVQYAEEFAEAYRFIFRVARAYLPDLRLIDVGGGFKVSYVPWEKSVETRPLGKVLTELRTVFEQEAGKPIRIIVEPGKYLTSNAGYLLAQVTATKKLTGRTIAYLNTGFNHLIRPMYYGARHMITNVSNPEGQKAEYMVVGYLCETDTFTDRVTLSEVRRGDILCFYNAGAYAITMASNYNSRPRPPEILWEDGSARMIRRSETLDDLLRLEEVS